MFEDMTKSTPHKLLFKNTQPPNFMSSCMALSTLSHLKALVEQRVEMNKRLEMRERIQKQQQQEPVRTAAAGCW